MTLSRSQNRGLVSTVLFHSVVLLMLLFWGFAMPYPPPQEEGFLVDFGNSPTGLGLEEPSAADAPEAVAATEKIVSGAKTAFQPPKAQKGDAIGDEDLLTQDNEKTISIASMAKKKLLEEEKAKRDKELKIKALEDKRLRAEVLEAKRQEAEDRRIEQEKAQKIGAINSRAKNAFGGGKTDNGSQSTSQGNTYGGGNQGSPNGTPGANQYGLGGGSGQGQGISFSLEGRNARILPKPAFPGNEDVIVVVEVIVDKSGKVTKASPGMKGSTTANPDFWEAARKAAMAANFNTDQNAPAFQKGTITYHFILQ